MEPNATFRRNVRGFYAWLGSMVVLGLAPLAAIRLLDRGTTTARLAAVAVGVGGMLPLMWVVFSIIRRSDEYARRLHLIALGFAFGGTVVLIVALDWLVRAALINPPQLVFVWCAALVLWLAALVGAKRYFERAV
ncbi:MAG: hypothetical protein ABJC89_15855 [Acidobacteriota bacterium]